MQYRTKNWKAYNAGLKSRGSLSFRLDKEMNWFGGSTGKRGRALTYCDAAIQFCLSLKCLFGLLLRQSMGLVESLLALSGLDWPIPDFSTISRHQKSLKVAIPYRARHDVLHLLVDSTGVKMLGEGEWKIKKQGADYRRQWRKVHLRIDPRRWKFGRLRSPATVWVTPPCGHRCCWCGSHHPVTKECSAMKEISAGSGNTK